MARVGAPSSVVFTGGSEGVWRITSQTAHRGEALPSAERLSWGRSLSRKASGEVWSLVGFTSNLRYASKADVEALRPTELALSRPGATCAALIPIRKSPAWWAMAQDEREHIFSAASRHSAIGHAHAGYVARKLFHARDIGGPFDFLTWFEFEPASAIHFDRLLSALRATPEWDYVDREVEIRLEREEVGQ